jgi:hypothetical protein
VFSVALTPAVIIGHHHDLIYFGMNDKYKINIAQMNGNIIKTFSLERNRRHISNEIKKDRLLKRGKGRAPVEILEMLAAKMPNDLTYFSTLENHNGFIYAFSSYYDRKNSQQIDIFTSEGKYLYRSYITVPQDKIISVEPLIKEGFVYLALENEAGDQSIGKFSIALPADSINN